MKILVVTQNIYSLGGIQRVVCDLCNYLVRKCGISVDVMMPCNYNGKKFYNIDNKVKIIDMKTILPKKNIFRKIILVLNKCSGIFDRAIFKKMLSSLILSKNEKKNFINLVNTNQYDFIISTGVDYTILISLLCGHVSSKIVGWQHSTFDSYFYKKKWWKKWLLFFSKRLL